MLDKKQKAAECRQRARERKEKEQHDAFKKHWNENLANGLTGTGYTKTFEGQSITFYLNNIEIKAAVDYKISGPHIEFRGEPSVLTETGYRSHFTNTDLGQFSTMKEMVEAMVAEIMSEERKRSKKYTLTWEPSLEFLKHSPVQLTLFEMKEAALCQL